MGIDRYKGADASDGSQTDLRPTFLNKHKHHKHEFWQANTTTRVLASDAAA
jgi:hypothetical protein